MPNIWSLPAASSDSEFKQIASSVQRVHANEPLTSLSLNHDIPATSGRARQFPVIVETGDNMDPQILDDDPDYAEDAEPETSRRTLTRGLLIHNAYIFKQIPNTLALNCYKHIVYPLKSVNIPRAWIPYLHAVPPHPDGKRILRDYYPLSSQQAQFNEWEATHPPDVLPGTNTFTLCTIPSYWDDEIPPVPLPYLIVSTISGSPSGMLTEREIKLALIRRFRYFANRLARNSRWQISANWILNRYACFERVLREATPEDDGCAYRAWSLPTFLTLIYPVESDLKEVPIHVFFPIDYGESVADLSLKPIRHPRQLRQLSSSIVLELGHESSEPPITSSHQQHPVPQDAEIANLDRRSDEMCLVWSPTLTVTTLCAEDVDAQERENMAWADEFSFGPGSNVNQIVEAGVSLRSNLSSVRLKDVWPKDAPAPWDMTAPSLWVQATLLQNVKLGSNEPAQALLKKKMLKAQQRFFEL